jgi:hypothetical protein
MRDGGLYPEMACSRFWGLFLQFVVFYVFESP